MEGFSLAAIGTNGAQETDGGDGANGGMYLVRGTEKEVEKGGCRPIWQKIKEWDIFLIPMHTRRKLNRSSLEDGKAAAMCI